MKCFLSLIFSILVIFSFGQLPGAKDPTLQIWKTLKGASFPKTIKQKLLINFTSDKKKDTIELTIPKGKIVQTNITIAIRTHTNKYFSNYLLPTYLFAYGVFDLESISNELSSDEHNAIYNQRLLSTSKLTIEQFTKSKIDSFFNSLMVNEMELENCLHLETYNVEEEALFMTILNDKKTSAIKVFSDEGEGIIHGQFMAYSPQKKEWVIIANMRVNAPSGYFLK